jgi:hypothetical protein
MITLIGLRDLLEHIDTDLFNKISRLCGDEHKSVSTIELTLLAVLADSMGRISKSEEEVEVQVKAYSKVIRAIALGAFQENH